MSQKPLGWFVWVPLISMGCAGDPSPAATPSAGGAAGASSAGGASGAAGAGSQDSGSAPPSDAAAEGPVGDEPAPGETPDAGADAPAVGDAAVTDAPTEASVTPDASSQCTPGAKQCSGNAPKACSAAGSWVTGKDCDYVCDAGVCKNLEYRVGRAEWVFGPDPALPDSHFTVVNVNGTLRGYSSGGVTRLFEGTSVPGLVDKGGSVIGPGTAFDTCGGWLQAVEPAGALLRGWYHAEEKCNYALGQTHKSVAYAESSDGGKTFVKVGYPNNRVLTGTNPPTTGAGSGSGDHSVVKRGDDYWMYFLDSATWKTGVARASVASGGKPGAWSKWYGGKFGTSALGGAATPIGYLGTNASLHGPSQQVVLVGPDQWFGGVKASFSANGVDFHTMSEPLVPFEEEDWTRPASTELITYPSVVPPTGGKQWSSSFYLFATYIRPGEGFEKRHLVRRRVDVSTQKTPGAPQVYLALWRHFYAADHDHWVTTSMVPPGATFSKLLGFILTKARSGAVPLYDCHIEGWKDHMVSLSESCEGATRLRRLGWLWSGAAAQPAGTKALYRCYDAANTNHFVSDSASCEGAGKMEVLLGYAHAS